jgi:PAS domain S-box-containing protein
VEGNPALICRFSPEGTLTYVNDTYCRRFGKTREELVGRSFAALIFADDQPAVAGVLAQLVPDMKPLTDEHRVIAAGGVVRWQQWTNMAIVDDKGEFYEYQAVGIDITKRKHLEDELRQVAADLSEANRRKDEFLATLAHELRNPLAPIRNGLQIMKLASDDAPSVAAARAMMERQLEQLVRLVDDLLDVSRITRGNVVLRKERAPLDAVLRSAVETSRPLIEQMGHQLTLKLPEQPVVVYGDFTRLAQVFLNLLNNAAKYSDPQGHLWMTAEPQGDSVAVTVRDTGIGIPADKLTSIFEMFSQVDRSLEKAQGGLGIGLTLVKQLVEMHGGSVEARSEGSGRGSEFLVRLPILQESFVPPAAPGDDLAPKAALRILIVDDNRDGAESLGMMLNLMGNQTRTAHDGEAGVAMAEKFRPDVVLIDIGMPKLNGYEACRRLREQPWGKAMLLIAVTGWGQDEDRRRSHEAGFDHHLVKPVQPQALMKLLTELSSVRGKR